MYNAYIHPHVQYAYLHCIRTGWRRPIGCLKLQVIFRERATNYRARLRKMTSTDKVSYDFTPPCITTHDQNTRTVLHHNDTEYKITYVLICDNMYILYTYNDTQLKYTYNTICIRAYTKPTHAY